MKNNQSSHDLNSLQKAYLLGRENCFPLGGVAMHDFREYRGEIDFDKFKSVMIYMLKKHPALRTIIDVKEMKQFVSDEIMLNLEEINLTHLSRKDALIKANNLKEQLSHRVHNLSISPWFMWIIQLPDDVNTTDFKNIIYMSFDALILDAFSISSLVLDIFSLYKGKELDDSNFLNYPYLVDFFSKKQQDQIFWQKKLQDICEIPNFPWKKNITSIVSSRYLRESISVPCELWEKISKLGVEDALLPNTTITTIILEVISLWIQADDIYVAMPISFSSLNPQDLGNKSSFIVVHYIKNHNLPFAERAKTLQTDILNSMEHLSFSGTELGRYALQKIPGNIPFPIVLTNGLTWLPAPQKKWMYYHSGITQTPQVAIDIRLSYSAEQNLLIDIDYAEEAVYSFVVKDILAAIARRMEQLYVDQNFEQSLDNVIKYLPAKNTVSLNYNFLDHLYHNIFINPPAKYAIISDEHKYTYQDVSIYVQQVIRNMIDIGIKQGDILAINLPKSHEHLMVTLACSLLGVIWVPIDTGSPPDRIHYLIQNCRTDWCISSQNINSVKNININQLFAENKQTINIEKFFHCDKGMDEDPAYYLYTSGSTGNPKCVVLNNKATSNVIFQTIQKWKITSDDIFINITPLHHDMSVFDIFAVFCVGGTLILPTGKEEKDAIKWAQLIEQNKVTLWCSVPAMLEMLFVSAKQQQLSSLRLIAQGGDYIKPNTVRSIKQMLGDNLRMFSLGGPTETTIWSIWHEISADDIEFIPYGIPVPGNQYFILNENKQKCPYYVIGTIFTTGINLSNGYLLEGEICTKDFVMIKDKQGNLVRAFQSSDQGYLREDGSIIFHSRKEGYLKVRGVRISAAEIEAVMSKYSNISNIIIVSYYNPKYEEMELAAAYTAKNNIELNTTELRLFAKQYLPQSHIPTLWVAIDNFPLTRNGKIDRFKIKEMIEKKINQNNQITAIGNN